MWWLIALALLGLLGIMPVGIYAAFNSEGVVANIIAGPVRITLYPKNEKPVARNSKKDDRFESSSTRKNTGGKLSDFLPIARLVLKFLGEFKRRLRVRELYMKLVLAGGDPCDLSINYGRAWAALGNFWPIIEQHFNIRKRKLSVECDYLAEQTRIDVRIDVVVSFAQLIILFIRHGIPVLNAYYKIINNTKGGATV